MYCYFSTQPIRSLLHRIYICFVWFFNYERISTITLCKNILIHSLTFLFVFCRHCTWTSACIQAELHIWARCLRLANLSSYGKTLIFLSIFFSYIDFIWFYIPELLLQANLNFRLYNYSCLLELLMDYNTSTSCHNIPELPL